MPSSKSSSKSRSATPEEQWSHDFTSSYYNSNKSKHLPPKRLNYHNDNDLNRKKFNHKRDLYMRKYGDNFDESKLPYYLRTFEAYIKGREDYLRNNYSQQQQHQHANNNNNNYRKDFWKLRRNSYSQQKMGTGKNDDEQVPPNRPLITLPRRVGLYTRNYANQQKANRARDHQELSPSRSRSRSPSSARGRHSESRSRSRSRTPHPPPPRLSKSPSQSPPPPDDHDHHHHHSHHHHRHHSRDLSNFSRSPSSSTKSSQKLSLTPNPVSSRYRAQPPTGLRSPSRSWSRSPPPHRPLQKISFRKRRYSGDSQQSNDDDGDNEGGSVKSDNTASNNKDNNNGGQRSPSKSPFPPAKTLKSTVVLSSTLERYSPYNCRRSKQQTSETGFSSTNQVRLSRGPSGSGGSSFRSQTDDHHRAQPLHSSPSSPPRSYRSSHERTYEHEKEATLTPPIAKTKPNYSLSLMHSSSRGKPETQQPASRFTANGSALDTSKGLHKSTSLQQPNQSKVLLNTSIIQRTITIAKSSEISSSSTAALQVTSKDSDTEFSNSPSPDLHQASLNSSFSDHTEGAAPVLPGAVPLDENGHDEDAASGGGSLVADFHSHSSRPYFVKGENIIFFTPCLETFYENITTAMKGLKYPPAFFETITSYSEERRQALTRILEATVVLAMGQSLALAYNNTAPSKVEFAELTIAELPVLRALRLIASQYGSVKCQQTGSYLRPIDHTGDVRAVVRMAASLLPEAVEVDKSDGKQKKQLVVLCDAEGRNVATRSWLPTYANDKRFFWIFALKVKEFMKGKLGIFSAPADLVDALSSLKKETPRWWTIFRDQLPREANGRFDFLWQNWNEETFYQNLGAHPAAPIALNAIGLKWPEPSQSHLCFDISLKNEIIRVYKYSFDNLKLYAANFNLMTCVELNSDHQGSWNQLASVINFMGWNVFKNCRETNKASQNLALRFPPKIFNDINNN